MDGVPTADLSEFHSAATVPLDKAYLDDFVVFYRQHCRRDTNKYQQDPPC
jgi:hypothetical protein